MFNIIKTNHIETISNINADFCVKITGDSMINARICDGNIVLVRKQSNVENGDIVIVAVGDKLMIRRMYMQDGIMIFLAENSKYEPLHYTSENLDKIQILGKVVAFQSEV